MTQHQSTSSIQTDSTSEQASNQSEQLSTTKISRNRPYQALIEQITSTLGATNRLLVVTGAGISANSGLPVYRDNNRQWQHSQPMMYQDFIRSEQARRRYWIGSFLGWPMFTQAQFNQAHRHLADWEVSGKMLGLITQNVDGLHQQAGHQNVLDLHGRLDVVRCLSCQSLYARQPIQDTLIERYGAPSEHQHFVRPDGDVQPTDDWLADFVAPQCNKCGGDLKPNVVFFGETIPLAWKQQSDAWLQAADAVLVVGSSLSVFSGFRFVRDAIAQGKPAYCINPGSTRADDILTAKLPLNAIEGLAALQAALDARQ